LRIGELSRRTGLSRDTIRFYEREGLIASRASENASNSYRAYPEETLERLSMINQARAAGFSVADLRRLFQGLDGMAEASFDAEGFLDEKMTELRRLIAGTRRLIRLLAQTKAALARREEPKPR
jgi:DNA-binding transcriptional MerR regulator